jgi:hypothetical protein
MKIEMNQRAAGACLVLAIACGNAVATGPNQQTLPWLAPQSQTLNGVVQVYKENGAGTIAGSGTGSIIGRKIDANGDGWFCVLTANHVVENSPRRSIALGDRQTAPVRPGRVGGGDNWYIAHPTLDIALVAVKWGQPDGFFNNLQLLTLAPQNVNDMVTNHMQFSQLGYGRSGSFVQGGLQTDNPVEDLSARNKRFQNNRIERTRNNVVTDSRGVAYTGVEFTFDRPAETGFLAAEGLSYVGDSGGPYLGYGSFANNGSFYTSTEEFTRPDDADGTVVPDWAGGLMEVKNQGIIAVHTFGNSNGAAGALSPYGSTGGGIPITNDLAFWITNHCENVIPAPTTAGAMAFGLLFAARRRR